MNYVLAQANAAIMKGSLNDPSMQSMASQIPDINTLAERDPGFIWRIKNVPPGSLASIKNYLRLESEDRIFFNLSVWRSLETLKRFTYETAHKGLLRDKHSWVPASERANYVLWWLPEGDIPTINEAASKFTELDSRGPTERAFTFRSPYPPPTIED